MLASPIAAERVALAPAQLVALFRPRTEAALVAAFERAVAEQLGVVRAVATARYAGAVELALRTLVRPARGTVITPAWTSTGALRGIGAAELVARAAPCDVDRCSLAPRSLAAHLDGSSAVVVRHVFGQLAHSTRLVDILKDSGTRLVEDAGLSFGASPVGRVGAVTVFDLGPGSALTALGGGLVTTRDPTLAGRLDELAAALPAGGFDATRAARSLVPRATSGLLNVGEAGARLQRMAPAQAGLALAGLEHVARIVTARTEAASDLTDGLSGLPGMRLQRTDRTVTNAWAGFSMRHAADPHALARRLLRRGVATRRPGLVRVGREHAWTQGTLLLPNHHGMSVADRHRVIRVVRELVLELAGL